MVISNRNSFRVLFDKSVSVYFIWKVYSYFSIDNGQPRESALCHSHRHSFVPYFQLDRVQSNDRRTRALYTEVSTTPASVSPAPSSIGFCDDSTNPPLQCYACAPTQIMSSDKLACLGNHRCCCLFRAARSRTGHRNVESNVLREKRNGEWVSSSPVD